MRPHPCPWKGPQHKAPRPKATNNGLVVPEVINDEVNKPLTKINKVLRPETDGSERLKPHRWIQVASPRLQQNSERKVLGLKGQGLEGVIRMSIHAESVVHESDVSRRRQLMPEGI